MKHGFLNKSKTITKNTPTFVLVSSHLELNFIPQCIFNWKIGTCLGWDVLPSRMPWLLWAIALMRAVRLS